MDKELEIQMQFLEEATDYLNALETVLLDVDTSKHIDLEKINSALRAAHSIKGGAAMMGFKVLSDLAHRLEDSFKVLKTRKNSLEIDTQLQTLLLSGVDWLRQIVELLAAGNTLDHQWLNTFCYPIFDELRDRLGEPPQEDISTMLSPEEGQDIIPMLFETEVDECLQRLESLLSEHSPDLQTKVATMAAELGGLGEMLQLPRFTKLCESVIQHLETTPDRYVEITQLALQAWRRSQALVLTNQRDSLPQEIDLNAAQQVNQVTETYQNGAVADVAIAENLEILNKNGIPEQNIIVPADIAPPDYKYIERKTEIHVTKDQENTVRVPSKQLEEINDLFGEIIIQRNGLHAHLERLRKLVSRLSQRMQLLDQEHQELKTAYAKIINQPALITNRENNGLAAENYQKLNALSQELTETVVQVTEISTDIQLSVDDTDQITRKLNKTSKQLQRKLTQVRMRPLSDLVDRFPRAIRDLNVEYGKNVQLKIEGGNTLIERSIFEALNEPLMHLLRNAFDHGIEDPATRRSQGKPEQGLIEIKAMQKSDRTIITMRDDGKGISINKIRHRALAMGLDPSLLATTSDQEIISLIFEPGFTTSEKVTALSGRGVGMDIVRRNLQAVSGEVTVDTQPGMGTTFTLSVPFTLSVTRVLLVECDGATPAFSDRLLLALPTDVVAEIFLLTSEKISVIDNHEFLNWQDNLLPLVRLGRYFQFNCSRYDNIELEKVPAINDSSVLIVKNENQYIAIQVDKCWGEQEVAMRQVEGFIPLPNGFSNCTILGDGRVIPLLNTSEVISWVKTNQLPQKSIPTPTTKLKTPFLTPQKEEIPAPASYQKGLILIVDDSINVRRYLALTLEKGGYQVEQAKDGLDAWEKLQNGLEVQAVICDIEMPRLDGYTFLERVNSHADLRHIPVAMLTSRSSNKHRQLAMQLGARAYFSKPYNEQELLKTLEEIILAETVSMN